MIDMVRELLHSPLVLLILAGVLVMVLVAFDEDARRAAVRAFNGTGPRCGKPGPGNKICTMPPHRGDGHFFAVAPESSQDVT